MTPSRRHFLKSAAYGAGAALLASPSTQAADAQTRRPNLVFLLTDDHRWNALGCMGNPILQTPQIDALAASGVLFTNAFVTTSICCASRASLFTGQYARRHGVHDFRTPFTPEALAQTYPQVLRRAGYRIGFIGKYGVGDNAKPPADQFDYWKGFTGQGHYFRKIDGKNVHLTDLMAEQAEEFIKSSSADQPFCLSVSFKAPHCQDGDPRQFLYAERHKDLYADLTIPPPPADSAKDFDRQPDFIQQSESRRRWDIRFSTPEKYQEMVKSYYRLITGVDEAVGRIRQALRQQNLQDNTIIIVMGDNGYYLGEHGLAGKWFMHEESIRVPLVVYDPRLPAPARGTRCAEMALNIDIAPTLLAMAGAAVPQGMQGRDLSPLLRGQKPAWRQEWFYEHLFPNKILPKSEGVRTQRWSYWRYLDVPHDAEWLHDLEADPRQLRNLASDPAHAQVLADLRRRVENYCQSLK